jgi:hypothetical protein
MKNPQAFPTHPDGTLMNDGMTLRDYFAAKAMQATIDAWKQRSIYPPTDDEVAKNAYEMADAMLKAREA